MKRKLLLLVMLSGYCLTGVAQSSPQTRTGTRFNDTKGTLVHNFAQGSAQSVASDDILYACTKKLTTQFGYAMLAVEGFGFTIPADATINNITVRVIRFKTGKSSIRDSYATLVKSHPIECFEQFGYIWFNSTDYSTQETEVVYSQSGSGNNGGAGNQIYKWTPALINDPAFGIMIQVNSPVGQGPAVVYYDLVKITVDFTVPTARTSISTTTTTTPLLNQPTVYPNPFTSQTNIQFFANESGQATVELYTVLGTKVRTLYSDNIVKGQAYNVAVAEAQLPKGIYMYTISAGGVKFTGRIIKME